MMCFAAAAISAATLSVLITPILAQTDGTVRLVAGDTSSEGRVEVFFDGSWGTVCDDSWDKHDAHVICRQLGFEKASRAYHRAYFGRGTGRIWIDEIDCPQGDVSSILQCRYNPLGEHDCSHYEDAGVTCEGKKIAEPAPERQRSEMYRLRGGPYDWKGRLEVKVNGKWGTICDASFDKKEGNIVCKAMGYGAATKIYQRAHFGRGVGDVHYSHLGCTGSEKYLADCVDSSHPSRCDGHSGDVGVDCAIPKPTTEPKSRMISVTIPRTSESLHGFVELKFNNNWGILCGGVLSTYSLDLACRQHRGEFYRASYSRSLTGIHSSVRYNGDIMCRGNETILEDCIWRLVQATRCSKDEVYVQCTPDLPDLVPHIEEFSRSLIRYPYLDIRPMYYLTCALEENCLSSSARGKPYYHRRKLLRFSSRTMNWGPTDFTPSIPREDWLWHSCHNHYHSFESFIHYDILDNDGQMVAEGHKASFCLEDSICSGRSGAGYRCGTGNQGISSNCGDIYGRYLDCQWIDVTDLMDKIDRDSSLPSGAEVRYRIQQHVNPSKLQRESDYRNNIATCDIWFTKFSSRYRSGNCILSDH